MAMSTSDRLIWRIKSGYEISSRVWDDCAVVYHSGTNSTHLLEANAHDLFLSLKESPATSSELAKRIAELNGIELDDALQNYVNKALSSLEHISLLEAERV